MFDETVRTVSTRIDRPADAVYDFLSQPENFPQWASGLCRSIEHIDGRWIAQTPEGPAGVRFTESNRFGVLDHYVELPDGNEVYVPMRVLPHADGAEVTLTIFRQPDMTAEKWQADIEWVCRDLAALKTLIESR